MYILVDHSMNYGLSYGSCKLDCLRDANMTLHEFDEDENVDFIDSRYFNSDLDSMSNESLYSAAMGLIDFENL